MQKTNAFILFTQPEQAKKTVSALKQSELIEKIFLLTPDETVTIPEDCEKIVIDRLQSTETIRKIAGKSNSGYSLIYQKPSVLKPGYFALERMARIAEDSRAGMVYADYYAIADDEKKESSCDRLSGGKPAR